jgi:uncharacterized protein (TIGR00369 family)
MSYLDDAELMERMYAAFRATPLHALLDLEFLAEEDYPPSASDGPGGPDAVVSMPVRAEAYGSTGNLHGGAIATLVDVVSATAAARNSAFVPGQNALVTADLHVRYLKRPHGVMVYGRARIVNAGRTLIVVECRVVDSEDRLIATADFSSMVVPFRQPLPGADQEPSAPEM